MGKYLNMVRQAQGESANKSTAVERIQTSSSSAITPGCRIIWQGADGMERSGVIDFLHTDADGMVWAFCTLPTGWCAAVHVTAGVTIERSPS